MVDQPNRCQTWLPTLLKIENLTKNRRVKIVKIFSDGCSHMFDGG
jgi:hypothetical protein